MICVFSNIIHSFSTVFFTSSWALIGRIFNIHISINNLFRACGFFSQVHRFLFFGFFVFFFRIISIICLLPTSEALSAFLGIWYSNISLPSTEICFSFLCCYNKSPQTRWLKTIELFFFLPCSFVGQKSRISITELKRRFWQNHSVSARFRGKSISWFCQILVTVSVVCLVSHHSNFCFCLHVTFFSFACEI